MFPHPMKFQNQLLMIYHNNMDIDIPSSIEQLSQIIYDRTITTNDFLDFDRLVRRTERRTMEQSPIWTGEINFLLWNATGLMANLDRVVKRMEDENLLFCFVTETWLNPKNNIPSVCRSTSAVCSIMPQGYERGKNGVSLIINPSMVNHPILKDMEVLSRDTLNGTYLYVQLGSLKVLCIYYPPSCPTEINIWLEEIFTSCKINSQTNLIILGDFNARLKEWGDKENNSNGRLLKQFIEGIELKRYDSGGLPTFIKSTSRPQDGWSIVDHIFGNINDINCSVVTPFNSMAGHRPILGQVIISADTRNAPPSYKRLKLEKIREEGIKDQLTHKIELISFELIFKLRNLTSSQNWNLLSSAQLQTQLDYFEKEMNCKLIKAAASILGEKISGKKIIKHEYLESDKLYAIETAILWETDESRLRELMRRAEKEKSVLRKEKFSTFAKSVGESPASDMMKIVSSMLQNRRKQQLALNSSTAALSEYRDHFASMNRNTLPGHRYEVEPRILNTVELPILQVVSSHFRPYVINDVLKRCQWNKSPGISSMTYDILKCGGENLQKLISEFFTFINLIGRVPSSWKRSLVVPVPKKGDLCKIQNYRPISLTEPLRKIYEHCILRYINENAGPTFLTQGGFRTNHCCNDMIVVLNEAMLSLKGKIHVAFLDIKAAYDSVDRKLLWKRCHNRGIHSEVINILKELFDSNTSQVVVNGRRSAPFHIESGVLQGSVLSPCLYSIFIDDLAYELSRSHKTKVGEAEINCTMYADDIALFADSPQKLQDLLDICSSHSEKNRYRFNASKCEVISDDHCVFKIHDQEMPNSKSFKYLGVEMKRTGICYKEFLKRRTDEATRSAEKLAGMGMNLGGLPLSCSAILYKVFIRPKLESSMCILPPLKNIFKKLEQTQCLILRRILRTGKNASSTICRSLLQTPRMYHRVKWLRTRYYKRFSHVLEPNHILKLSSISDTSWINLKLKSDIYSDDVEKHQAWSEEMHEVHEETKLSTGGNLIIPTSKKLVWFLNSNIPPPIIRPILSWILKRYPGRDPPRCSFCLSARATQEHIAHCFNFLNETFPETIPRFRPEKLLCNRPDPDTNLLSYLKNIAQLIATAVNRSIPDLHFEILSGNFF